MITESYYGVVRKEESLNRLILAIDGGTVTEIPEAESEVGDTLHFVKYETEQGKEKT